MCKYCTRKYVSNKIISDYVNKKLFVQVDHILYELSNEISVLKKIYLLANSNITGMSLYGLNFGVLYYEGIAFPFMVWKLVFDVLCRVVLNVS